MVRSFSFQILLHFGFLLQVSSQSTGPIPGNPLCARIGNDIVDATPVIQTTNGAVRGCETEGGGIAYTLPFAEPPVGDLRFKAPQPKENWKGIYDGTQFATMCPQFSGSHDNGVFIGDEDCLYITVHQPNISNINEPLPVMFWIYGGAFMLGDSYEFGLYDTKHFVDRNNVIFVSFNYRVGPFGFLAHEALQEEDAKDNNVAVGSTGNMGLRDQRLAMQWVQDNIAAFSGDPNKVTIFGESAGALSVCAHVANGAMSKGLFQHAIMESGTCDSLELFLNVDEAMIFGNDYSNIVVGCDATALKSNAEYLDCMRSVNASDILYGVVKGLKPLNSTQLAMFNYMPPLFPLIPFALVVDGVDYGIPEMPLNGLKNGNAMNVSSMIMGTNKDEGTIFVPFVKTLYDIEIRMNLNDLYIVLNDIICTDNFPGADCNIYEIINDHYNNCTDYPHVDACAAAILRDYIFTCPTRRAVGAMCIQGGGGGGQNNIYQYQFTMTPHWIDMIELGNYHMSELYFVFGNPWPLRGNETQIHNFNDDDFEMISYFNEYWSNLAKYGNPNGNPHDDDDTTSLVEWPSVIKDPNSLDGMSHMNMKLPPTVEYALEDEVCDFWDNFLGFD